MISLDDLEGPSFATGDFISVDFSHSSVTLKIPSIPRNDRSTNFISSISNFSTTDFSGWDALGDERLGYSLLEQSWKFQDKQTHDDIAHAFFSADLLKLNENDVKRGVTTTSSNFRDFFVKQVLEDFELDESSLSSRSIPRVIDGVVMNLPLGQEASEHSPVAFFSLGGNLSIRFILKLGAMHYADRKNPINSASLIQLKEKLLNEFLDNLCIEYK